MNVTEHGECNEVRLRPYHHGWSWAVVFPNGPTAGGRSNPIRMGRSGWNWTRWGARRSIRRAERDHE